jgi:hypothetical protein
MLHDGSRQVRTARTTTRKGTLMSPANEMGQGDGPADYTTERYLRDLREAADDREADAAAEPAAAEERPAPPSSGSA